MSFFYHQAPYQVEKAILKSVENISSTKSVRIEASTVGLNKEGRKVVPGGLWVASVGGATRFLPRAKTTTAVATGSTQIPVDLQQVFQVGDVLRTVERKASITLGGTFLAGDVIFVTYDTGTFAYTVKDPANLAANLTNYINGTANFEGRAVLTGSTINLFSARGGSLSVLTNSAAGTVTVVGYAGQGFLGKVTAIDYKTATVTIDTATTVALDQGAKVGVPVDLIHGFHIHSIDFTDRPTCNINAIDGADAVYSKSFPYLDSEIRARFPRIGFD